MNEVSVKIIDLDGTHQSFWEMLNDLRRQLMSNHSAIVLRLTRSLHPSEYLPHHDFSTTLSEGLITERSEQIVSFFQLLNKYPHSLLFYTEVPLSGFFAELALSCDYLALGRSDVTVRLTRFFGLTPASALFFKLYQKVGKVALNWYLNETTLGLAELVKCRLSLGLYPLASLLHNDLPKPGPYARPTTIEKYVLRYRLYLARRLILKVQDIDPILQLCFVDLIERLLRFGVAKELDILCQYYYECAVSSDYRQAYQQYLRFPRGVLSSLVFVGESWWENALILKMVASHKHVRLHHLSVKRYNELRRLAGSEFLCQKIDQYLSVVPSSDNCQPVEQNNALGISFILDE